MADPEVSAVPGRRQGADPIDALECPLPPRSGDTSADQLGNSGGQIAFATIGSGDRGGERAGEQ